MLLASRHPLPHTCSPPPVTTCPPPDTHTHHCRCPRLFLHILIALGFPGVSWTTPPPADAQPSAQGILFMDCPSITWPWPRSLQGFTPQLSILRVFAFPPPLPSAIPRLGSLHVQSQVPRSKCPGHSHLHSARATPSSCPPLPHRWFQGQAQTSSPGFKQGP